MRFFANEQKIRELASNLKVFMRGRNLFNAKERVGPLFYDAEKRLISAKVSSFSGHVYDTFVAVNERGMPEKASCSCKSFGKFKGCCKHVTALLLAADAKGEFTEGEEPEALPEGHALLGRPVLRQELIGMDELLRIVGPGEKTKRKRGRPSKKDVRRREAEKASSAAKKGGGVSELLEDRTVTSLNGDAAASKETGEAYIKIRSRLGEKEEPEDNVLPLPLLDRVSETAADAGELYLRRLSRWEERERNLLRTADMQERDPASAHMEIYLEFVPDEIYPARLSLRVGDLEHPYIVNQAGSFLRAYREREAMLLGTYFTWKPPFRLDRSQQLFIDWFENAYREEGRRAYARGRELADAKWFSLSAERLRDFLKLSLYFEDDIKVWISLNGHEFPLRSAPELPEGLRIHISEAEPETKVSMAERAVLELSLADGERRLKPLKLDDIADDAEVENELILLSDKGLLLYRSTVLACRERADRILWQLIELLAEQRLEKLSLNAAEASLFLSFARDNLRDEDKLFLEPGFREKMVEEPLEIKHYVDVIKDTLWLSPFFCYGDYSFRPLLAGAPPRGSDGEEASLPVVRDRGAEREFEHFLQEQGFSAAELKAHQTGLVTKEAGGAYVVNQFYLQGEEAIFAFLRGALPELGRMGTIYASPAFRALKIAEPSEPEIALDYDDAEGKIRIHVSMDGFSPEEAARIIRACQKNKPFARLKDGRFVDLNAERKRGPRHKNSLRDLVSTMADWGAEWKDGAFEIPKYRGLALHGFLEERQFDPKMIGDERSGAWQRLIEDRKDPSKAAPALPAGVEAKLRPYQLMGYQWLCFLDRYDMGGILADEMGLGKTLQMLVFLWKLYQDKPAPMLVVAPTSLLYNWYQEARRFVPGLPCTVIEGTKPMRREQYRSLKEENRLIILSYGLARQDRRELRDFDFACIVLDEAQNIKNPLTKTSRAVKSLRGRRRFALTGTPLENHVGELWSIFDFIMPGYLFGYAAFQNRFAGVMNAKRVPADADGEEQRALENARESLHQLVSPFILRRLKQDVLEDLPDKIITDIPCVMTPEQQALYRRHLARARSRLTAFDEAAGEERGRRRMDILGELTRLRQICCDPALFVPNYQGGSGKLDALADLLENLLENGHRILLFSQFTSMLQIIKKQQEELGRRVLYIDGSVSSKERLELVSHFNAGDGDIFLISLKAGGTGLNLTGADVVVHYDPWWNPAVENQATDRAHRMGQRKVVQVFRMVTIGSIEEKIQEMQQAKQALLDDIVAPGATFINRMDLDDIRELFSE